MEKLVRTKVLELLTEISRTKRFSYEGEFEDWYHDIEARARDLIVEIQTSPTIV